MTDIIQRLVLIPFMFLAAWGFAFSLLAHCLALANIPVPGGKLVWGLHIGIFIVWLPAVLVSTRACRYANRKDLWKIALAGCHAWMRGFMYILFGYAVLNFVFFMATTASQHSRMTGDAPPSVIRGFSGHWMVFYYAAFAILYSRIHAPHLYHDRKCPYGHSVSPLARFCPECGSEICDASRSA